MHDEEGVRGSLDLAQHFDFEQGVADSAAGLRHLSGLPEVEGDAGIVGFCPGGSIAYFLAAQNAAATIVSFYGSVVPGRLEILEAIERSLQQAGHAFHNRMAPMFHMPEPAARAWRRTEDFLSRHLPV